MKEFRILMPFQKDEYRKGMAKYLFLFESVGIFFFYDVLPSGVGRKQKARKMCRLGRKRLQVYGSSLRFD